MLRQKSDLYLTTATCLGIYCLLQLCNISHDRSFVDIYSSVDVQSVKHAFKYTLYIFLARLKRVRKAARAIKRCALFANKSPLLITEIT